MGNKGRRKPDVRKGTRNLRETQREQERGDAWRTGTHSKEQTGESRRGKWKRRNGERSSKKRKRRNGSSEQCSHLPGKKRAQARMEPDPAEIAGGDAPPCAEPPAAPTLYQSTAEPHSI
ncbi:MAG: hypothetical protein CMB65_06025 [Euryarchaeota archaeon]|nr:hypothetical protein [Euryarchaeota archaeon]